MFLTDVTQKSNIGPTGEKSVLQEVAPEYLVQIEKCKNEFVENVAFNNKINKR